MTETNVKRAEPVASVARVLKVRGRDATKEMMAVMAAKVMVQVPCPVIVFHHLAPTRQCRPMMKVSGFEVSIVLYRIWFSDFGLTVQDEHDSCSVESPLLAEKEHLANVTDIAHLGVTHAELPCCQGSVENQASNDKSQDQARNKTKDGVRPWK
jgi:hypothetical protein